MTLKSLAASDEVRSRVGGINPLTLRPDSENRFALFEKVRSFYVQCTNAGIVRSGLGEVVDWTIKYGEEELNAKLRSKYRGFDLKSVKDLEKNVDRGDKDAATTIAPSPSVLGNRQKRGLSNLSHLVSLPRNPLKIAELDKAQTSEDQLRIKQEKELLRLRLRDFYERVEPAMLGTSQFDRIVDYGMDKGVAHLNLKLQKRYGPGNCLDVSEYEEEKEAQTERNIESTARSLVSAPVGSRGRGVSFTKLFRQAERERATSYRSVHSYHAKMLRQENREKKKLPPQLRMFLKLYYACYDPTYLLKNKLSDVEKLAEKDGLYKFDIALKKKYKESLSEFQARVEIIQDKLHGFYLEIDIKRINDSMMQVLQWTMRNGIPTLNRQLTKKYGKDLNSYKENAEIDNKEKAAEPAEPEF